MCLTVYLVSRAAAQNFLVSCIRTINSLESRKQGRELFVEQTVLTADLRCLTDGGRFVLLFWSSNRFKYTLFHSWKRLDELPPYMLKTKIWKKNEIFLHLVKIQINKNFWKGKNW